MNIRLQIAHPEWLEHSSPEKSINLFRAGQMPRTIAGWMIVVGCKHPLRAVYGSDLRAGWALLTDALRDKLENAITGLRCRVWRWWHDKPEQAYWEFQEQKIEREMDEPKKSEQKPVITGKWLLQMLFWTAFWLTVIGVIFLMAMAR